MQFELELRKLEYKPKVIEFDVTKHVRLVPPFQERDADNYFLHFEKVAENLKWSEEFWTMLLQSVLSALGRPEKYTVNCQSSKLPTMVQ